MDYIGVSKYKCMCIYTYIHIHMRIDTCANTHLHACIHVRIKLWMYIYMYTLYIYICIRICDMSVCGYMILIWCSFVWHSGTDELFQQWNDLSKRDKLLHDFVHRCWRPDQDHVQNKAGSKP